VDIEDSDDVWAQKISTLDVKANRPHAIIDANKSIYALENFKKIMEDIYASI